MKRKNLPLKQLIVKEDMIEKLEAKIDEEIEN